MRIAQIDVNYTGSSTGKIVYDLINELNQKQHVAKAFYGRGEKIDDTSSVKIASDIEVLGHALLTRISGFTGTFSPLATSKLLSQIKSFKPDIVHLHELHGYYINIEPIVDWLKSKKIKTVWTFHCEFMYTGKCGYAYDCDKWQKKCHSCPQVKEYPASWFFDRSQIMHASKKKMFENFKNLKIVTPSKWLANRVQQSFLKDKDIRVIPNGIDTSVFQKQNTEELRNKLNIKNKKVVLAVAPNLMDERKGGEHVLEIAKKFEYRQDLVFIMVGVDKIIDTIKNVIMIKQTANQKELATYYSLAELFLICSEKETFSLVTAESLACGTPVLGFKSGATEKTAPSNYGYFVAYGDHDEILKKITKFFDGLLPLKNPNDCIKFAQKYYSKKVMLNNYLNLYKEMMEITHE